MFPMAILHVAMHRSALRTASVDIHLNACLLKNLGYYNNLKDSDKAVWTLLKAELGRLFRYRLIGSYGNR